MNNIVKTRKDKSTTKGHTNVVYKIDCQECDSSYVGQTKRRLEVRVKEHQKNILLPSEKLNGITYQ